jgi:hypothetical protein
MPIKMIVMVRRKPGLSPEEFREGYENSHSRIAVELFGHLWLSYQRNYLTSGRAFARPAETAGPADVGFDAISEYVLRDEAALADMARIAAENFARIKADEALWFDQAHSWSFACETVEERLSAGT